MQKVVIVFILFTVAWTNINPAQQEEVRSSLSMVSTHPDFPSTAACFDSITNKIALGTNQCDVFLLDSNTLETTFSGKTTNKTGWLGSPSVTAVDLKTHLLAAIDTFGYCILWDTRTPENPIVSVNQDNTRTIRISPDLKKVALAGGSQSLGDTDGFLSLIDLTEGKQFYFKNHECPISSANWKPDNATTIALGRDNRNVNPTPFPIFCLNLGREAVEKEYKSEGGNLPAAKIVALAWHPNKQDLVSADYTHTAIDIWDTVTPWNPLKRHMDISFDNSPYQDRSMGKLSSINFLPDGSLLTGSSNQLCIWDTERKTLIAHFPINCQSVLTTENHIITAGKSGLNIFSFEPPLSEEDRKETEDNSNRKK